MWGVRPDQGGGLGLPHPPAQSQYEGIELKQTIKQTNKTVNLVILNIKQQHINERVWEHDTNLDQIKSTLEAYQDQLMLHSVNLKSCIVVNHLQSLQTDLTHQLIFILIHFFEQKNYLDDDVIMNRG